MNTNDLRYNNINASEYKVEVRFKKTIQIRDYETEVFESSNSMIFNRPLYSVEKIYYEALLTGQLEFQCYSGLLNRGLINQATFDTRINGVLCHVEQMKNYAEVALGRPITS